MPCAYVSVRVQAGSTAEWITPADSVGDGDPMAEKEDAEKELQQNEGRGFVSNGHLVDTGGTVISDAGEMSAEDTRIG